MTNAIDIRPLSVRYDELTGLFTDVLTALYRLPAVEWKFQEPQFQREFNAAFGPERQAQVCRNWIARLPKAPAWCTHETETRTREGLHPLDCSPLGLQGQACQGKGEPERTDQIMSDLSYSFDPAVDPASAEQQPESPYPAWQQKIREAQIVMEERQHKERQARHEQKRQQDATDAANLKKVLGLLGIEAEPASDTWMMEPYGLRLMEYTITPDEAGISFRLKVFSSEFSTDDPDNRAFVQAICLDTGTAWTGIDNDNYLPCWTIDTFDWIPLRARLADALGKIDHDIAYARLRLEMADIS